jgi:hypothetical protein
MVPQKANKTLRGHVCDFGETTNLKQYAQILLKENFISKINLQSRIFFGAFYGSKSRAV